jgi:hypothetical protein
MSFPIGQRIRVNYWVDRRESGWHYGTVLSESINCFGVFAQKVRWENDADGYESICANALFEAAAPMSETNEVKE